MLLGSSPISESCGNVNTPVERSRFGAIIFSFEDFINRISDEILSLLFSLEGSDLCSETNSEFSDF